MRLMARIVRFTYFSFFVCFYGRFQEVKVPYDHAARFSNYEVWLSDPTRIRPSAQVIWPIVGQEILNDDVGGGFRGIQIIIDFFSSYEYLE